MKLREFSTHTILSLALALLHSAAVAAPSSPTLISPIGKLTAQPPEFHWAKVEDATWYRLWVNDENGTAIKAWHKASNICGDTTCNVQPEIDTIGTARWQVRGYDGNNLGAWSARGMFWDNLPIPTTAMLVSPLVATNLQAPEFTWSAVPDATWYKIHVEDLNGIQLVSQWLRVSGANVDCDDLTCRSTPTLDLDADFIWKVRAYNAAGLGPWTADESIFFSDAPRLESLNIVGADASTRPNFNSDIKRYSVLPTENTSQITITASTTIDSHTLKINDQLVSNNQPVTILAPAEGQIISINVNSPTGEINHYEIIYLGVGFPAIEITTLTEDVSEGVLYLNAHGNPSFAIVMDNYGVPIYFKRTPPRSSSFQKHADGRSSYGLSNRRHILDENFQELLQLQIATPLTRMDQHDFLILPNGNYVFLSYDPELHDGFEYEDSVIQEVDASTGQEVFQWRSWNVIPLADQLRPDENEYAHINSVFLDDDNNYLASLRGTSQIVKINRTTGAVMWKLGGLSNEFTISDPLGGPCGQHDVTRLANGNILFFDNGIYCPPSYPERIESSRAVEYELDEENKIATLVWSYAQPGSYSSAAGSARRLPNGNTLIGWGGRPTGPSATEVDNDGNVVWEFNMVRSSGVRGSYRVLRYFDPNE